MFFANCGFNCFEHKDWYGMSTAWVGSVHDPMKKVMEEHDQYAYTIPLDRDHVLVMIDCCATSNDSIYDEEDLEDDF